MPTSTIAVQLECDRLQSRVRRMELVTAALRDRAVNRHAITGITPEPLQHAIAGFESELDTIRRRLAQLRCAQTPLGDQQVLEPIGAC